MVYEQLVKAIGCSNLKQLVESDKIIRGLYIINELSTYICMVSFVRGGCNDDFKCAYCLRGTDQTYFKELTDNDIDTDVQRPTTSNRTG